MGPIGRTSSHASKERSYVSTRATFIWAVCESHASMRRIELRPRCCPASGRTANSFCQQDIYNSRAGICSGWVWVISHCVWLLSFWPVCLWAESWHSNQSGTARDNPKEEFGRHIQKVAEIILVLQRCNLFVIYIAGKHMWQAPFPEHQFTMTWLVRIMHTQNSMKAWWHRCYRFVRAYKIQHRTQSKNQWKLTPSCSHCTKWSRKVGRHTNMKCRRLTTTVNPPHGRISHSWQPDIQGISMCGSKQL